MSELLDQVAWDERQQDQPVDLIGDQAFLDYVFRPHLYLLGDRINDACQAAVDRSASVEPIPILQQQLTMLLDLLRHTHDDGGSEPAATGIRS